MLFNNSFYIALHRAAINFLIWTSSLLFFFRLFYLSTQFISILTVKSSAIHWLTCFWVSSRLFLVLFWMLFKVCHVLHASWITTWATLFTERLFSMSKEWVRSWSHASFIIYDKTFAKKLKTSVQNPMEKEKRERTSPVFVTRVIDNNTVVSLQKNFCQPVQKKWWEGKKGKKN